MTTVGVAGSSPYDPEKPGIKSLAAAKEKRDRKAKERTLQLETDLAEALNNRDRCLNDLRKAQNVKSAANAILKAYKKEIDKQQTKDSMAWSRALERAETFVGRIQKILSVDGLKILNKHQSSMRKFYDAMHELRTNIARLERICPSDSSGEQLSSLDKQALTKEIEILRAENEMLRERNTATDLNSDDYYHVNVDTNTRSQLQLKSAQLASARQQLRQMQETNKALVSAIRNVFPSMQGLSDEDIMSTASKEPHGNQPTSLEPPKNSAIQSHSGGQLQLPHGSFTQLQRLAHSTTLKKQTSLKQLFDDFHTVPGKAQKSSNSNTGSSSKSVSQYSSARTTNSSRTTQNVSAKKVQSLQEQVNILADELVRLCFLLGKAEAKASKDPSGKEQRQGKKPKKKKGNTEASQWKTEMEERVTSIEACLGESSSTALNALNIAQDSIRMVTRHCAEAEDRLSHSQARICAENENLRQKISRLGRLLERTRASNASLKSAASSSELAPINSKSKSTKSSAQSSARNTSTSSPLIPENSPSLQPRSSSSKRLPKKNSPQIPKKPSESSMKPSPLANSTRTTVSSAPSSESIVHRPNESSVTPTKAETRGQMFDTVNSHRKFLLLFKSFSLLKETKNCSCSCSIFPC